MNVDRLKWVGLILALLLFSVGTQTILIVSAVSSPSFAVVPDYEARARDWDTEQRQRSINRELAWTLNLEIIRKSELGQTSVEVSIFDTYGKPVRNAAVQVRAFHLARSNRIVAAHPPMTGDGLYTHGMALHPPGLWEFQVVVERGADRYTETIRKSLGR